MQPMNNEIFDEGKMWVLDIFQTWSSPFRDKLQAALWNAIVFGLYDRLERELGEYSGIDSRKDKWATT